ncbi:MAG: hypothetical protein J7L26_10965 [Candidatus Aminicenantes bacterium]|nr:hypothetical protein [Candidatus Aminicenantes bacterium]
MSKIYFSQENEWVKKELSDEEKAALNLAAEKREMDYSENIYLELICIYLEYYLTKRISLKELLNRVERRLLLRVLEGCGGNQRAAAKILGLNYTTLNEKVKRHGIRFQKKPYSFYLSSPAKEKADSVVELYKEKTR